MQPRSGVSWYKPVTRQEAWETLKESGSVLVGGGTDLMPLLRYGLVAPTQMVSLDGIQELREISWQEEHIFIGSAVTLTELAEHGPLADAVPVLAEAARSIASPQIRNIATIGGNIFQSRRCIYFNQTSNWRRGLKPCLKMGGSHCYQAPRTQKCRALYHSDMAPALLALGAKAIFYAEGGSSIRELRDELQNMVDLPQRLAGHAPRLCIGFLIPRVMSGALCHFYKYSIRGAIDFPLANFCCSFLPEGKRNLVISVGAMAAQPLILEKTAAAALKYVMKGACGSCSLEKIAEEELVRKSLLIKDSGVSLAYRRRILVLTAKELAYTLGLWCNELER
jgi:4-hydroxybenzoyl-CoA reductase subunit beta